jgi:site-specific recombinase XerD
LRFFYTKTLRRNWSIADTPYPKRTHRLPTILSQEEVAQLIDAASTPFHRTLLMTLYATGARNKEATRLKFSDVDSKRMVIHIQGGKGRRDRLCAAAHNRSDVLGKVMCRESRSIHKKHRLLRVLLDSGCASSCT